MYQEQEVTYEEMSEVAWHLLFIRKNYPELLVFTDAEQLNSFVFKITGKVIFESQEEIVRFTDPYQSMLNRKEKFESDENNQER